MRHKKQTDTDNMHGDHIATCLCCIHAEIDPGSLGYSEMTPGSPSICECERGYWSVDRFDLNIITIMHDSAKRCGDFSPRA